MKCWLAPRDIGVGRKWTEAVCEAAERTPNMVVLLSPAALASNNVESEVTIAFQADVRIFPVQLSPTSLPDSLRYSLHQSQLLNAAGVDEAEWMSTLIAEIGQQAAVAQPPPTPSLPATSHATPPAAATARGRLTRTHKWIAGVVVCGGLAASFSKQMREKWASTRRENVESPSVVEGASAATPEHETPAETVKSRTTASEEVARLIGAGKRAAAIEQVDAALLTTPDDAELLRLRDSLYVTNSIGMRLLCVPAGSQHVGSPVGELDRGDDEPMTLASIDQPFFLGQTEVTCAQFGRFVEATGHRTSAESEGGGHYHANGGWQVDPAITWRTPGFAQADDHPVVVVSWNDACAFCAWLSTVERRTYRLPDEFEWEIACRAMSSTAYPWGNDGTHAAWRANLQYHPMQAEPNGPSTAVDDFEFTAPVGFFQPNPWGFHDMIGNVGEWCANPYSDYPIERAVSCSADRPRFRAYRGGGWLNYPDRARSAHRFKVAPDRRFSGLGFRVLLETP